MVGDRRKAVENWKRAEEHVHGRELRKRKREDRGDAAPATAAVDGGDLRRRSTAAGVRRLAGGRRSTQASSGAADVYVREREKKYITGCLTGRFYPTDPLRPIFDPISLNQAQFVSKSRGDQRQRRDK